MNRTFKTVALPILVVFVLVYVAQSMFHFGGSSTPTKKAGWGTLVATREHSSRRQICSRSSSTRAASRSRWVIRTAPKFSAGYPRTGDAAGQLVDTLVKGNGVSGDVIEFSGVGGNEWLSLLLGALPFVLFLGLWIFLINQMQGGGSKVMSFGKSRAKRMAVDSPKITFKDVAGADEAVEELHEIKEFLENPKKFQALGARIPKGVLLYGPPGTGKTLLARAVAGEAGVPFFSISGSDFVEMFVGVGASRVRDLFEQAKQNAPCIIFMDEIDAVGRHRGAGLGGGHDEREQTLNQLLVEMDGFELKDNIILIAATNRPDILDPALLRPGRFDRQIVVDRPDRDGRKKILEVHTKGKPIAREIDLGALAGQTPGFTGADLANLVNEAALLAARRGRKVVGQDELEEGIMRVIAGPEKKTRLLSEKERLVTAYHEMGHALVAHYLEGCDPVHKISVISRGQALGYTISMPTEDTYLTTRTQLRDTLAMTLGGRAAEELVYDERTTGAANDLEKVTATAKAMIMRFGMSEKLGPRAFGRNHDQPFLGREYSQEPDYSDEVAREIDAEIQRIVEEADQRAKTVLAAHSDTLHRLAKILLERETIDRSQFLRLLDGAAQEEVFPPPSAARRARRGAEEGEAQHPPGSAEPPERARRPARRRVASLCGGAALASATRAARSWASSTSRPTRSPTAASYADLEAALAHGRRLAAEGAAIVDVGGESTRPGAEPVSGRARARARAAGDRGARGRRHRRSRSTRARPRSRAPRWPRARCSSTTSPPCAAIPSMAAVVAEAGADLCLMHMLGEPRTMQDDPRYDDVVGEVESFLAERAEAAVAAGVARERIALDPGIGFGKTLAHNLALLRALPRLAALGPLLLGVSRKRFLGALTGREIAADRVAASVAAAL